MSQEHTETNEACNNTATHWACNHYELYIRTTGCQQPEQQLQETLCALNTAGTGVV